MIESYATMRTAVHSNFLRAGPRTIFHHSSRWSSTRLYPNNRFNEDNGRQTAV